MKKRIITIYELYEMFYKDNISKWNDPIVLRDWIRYWRIYRENYTIIYKSNLQNLKWISIEEKLPKWLGRDVLQGYSEYIVKSKNDTVFLSRVSDHDTWKFDVKELGITHWLNYKDSELLTQYIRQCYKDVDDKIQNLFKR